MIRRQPGRTRLGLRTVALVVLAGAAPASDASAQDPTFTPRPLEAGHWAYDFAEILHAAGARDVWLSLSDPLPAGTLREAFDSGAAAQGASGRVAERWSTLLDAEAGLGGAQPLRFALSAGYEATEVSVVPERGGFASGLADVPLGSAVGLWAEGGVSSAGSSTELISGGLAYRFGAGQLVAGRMRGRLGQGTTRVLMDGNTSLDGVLVSTARPFRLPGFLGFLGRVTGHFFLSPNISTPTTDRAWYSSMGGSFEPHPSITIGAYRSVRFAGEGINDNPTLSDLLTVFSGTGGRDRIDDSQGEVAVRARFRVGGQAIAPYLSLGFEDPPSIWEDPGIVAGLLVPIDLGAGVLAARYEYQAFGEDAQWCRSCTYVSHRWYDQRTYGPYTLDDIPLGSTLGGYGNRHRVELTYWGSAPVRVSGALFLEERAEGNILLDRWPGSRTGLSGSITGRPRPGWEVAVSGVGAWAEDKTEGGVNVTVRLFDLLGNPAGLQR